MLSQVTGAFVRAILVMVLITVPSVLAPGSGDDSRQMAALVAVFAGVLTFVEYKSAYPGLIEFRDAKPYNRLRFCMLFAMVLSLGLVARHEVETSPIGSLVAALSYLSGQALDFPYSPVRLITILLAGDGPPELALAVRSAAGMAVMIALLLLAVFVVILRMTNWPLDHGSFNVWVNLPTFDPTAGRDVVARLGRDGRANILIGLLLPFVIPAVVQGSGMGMGMLDVTAPQTLIWVVSAWAFLSASLIMRGIAMGRVAAMIRTRRDAPPGGGPQGYAAA